MLGRRKMLSAWSVCAFAGLAGAQSDCGPLFADQIYTDGLVSPTGIAFGDVDGDTIPDMVGLDGEFGAGVYIGAGDGTFGDRVNYPMGNYIPDIGAGASAIRLGDMDGDGDLDIVTCGFQFDEGECEPGDPECCDPKFDPECFFRGPPPAYINNGVSIRLNNGDGTFAPFFELQSTADPQDLVLADLDGDNDLDIAITEFDNFIGMTYWLNDGTANFPASGFSAISIGGTAIEAGDMDGDGDQDLVVARSFSHVVDVLINDGTASFAAAASYPLSAARPGGLELGDVDGDGDLDVAATVDAGSRLNIFINDGSGVLGPVGSVGTGSDPTEVELADIDDDGDLDAVVASAITRSVRTHLNDGAGSFAADEFFSVGGVNELAIADVNGDGLVDVGMGNSIFSASFAVRFNSPDGLDAPKDQYFPFNDPTKLACFDFDNDGDMDIAVGRISSLSPNLAVLVNAGDGTYPTTVNLFTESSPFPATGDVNGDGFSDIVSANLSGRSMSVFLNNQAGGFAAPVKTELGGLVRGAALVDLDGDLDLDFVTDISASNILVLMFNDGLGVFGGRVDIPVADSPSVPAIDDVDGDGDMDIVVPRRNADVIEVLLNNGSGSFSSGGTFATDEDPNAVDLRDLDGDGDLDAVTANIRVGSVDGLATASLLFNNGAGVFSGRIDLPPTRGADHVRLGDIDDDGDTDLVVSSRGGPSYTVFTNADGFGTTWASREYLQGRGPRWAEIRDVNQDGLTDVILGEANGPVAVAYSAGCSGAPVCAPDLFPSGAPDGVLNFFDLGEFLSLFGAMDPVADFFPPGAPDGVFNFFDLGEFLTQFGAGCP